MQIFAPFGVLKSAYGMEEVIPRFLQCLPDQTVLEGKVVDRTCRQRIQEIQSKGIGTRFSLAVPTVQMDRHLLKLFQPERLPN